MTQIMHLMDSETTGKDIQIFLDGVLPLTVNMDRSLVFLSAITLAILTQNSDLDMDTLRDAIQKTSEYVSLYLAGYGEKDMVVN